MASTEPALILRASVRHRVRATRRRLVVLAAVLATGLGLFSASAVGASAPSGHGQDSPSHDVIANLFEWNWASVATECSTVLGPNGYGGVQVAPPQDSLKRTTLGNGSDTVLHPWWEVYQPTDYNLTSRMGTEAQFISMVASCRKAGVKVIVDAVINHMTGQGATSYGATTFTKYNYPGVYTPANFHKYPQNCPVPAATGDSTSQEGSIADFNNLIQVRKCELVGLSDLRTESEPVRARLATYLNKLIGYGVSGFRVDAAKHIGQSDLAAIEARLHNTVDGKRPYIALEVFPGGPGALSPFAFQSVGNLLGLDADVVLKNAFKSYPTDAAGSIATLRYFSAGLVPSDHSLSFVQNHDTERNGDALSYKDGALNTLANEYLLASGYGTPEVYASFKWATTDASPPSGAQGLITNTDCAAGWACIDRQHAVLAMVRFHNLAGTAPVQNWTDDGANFIAFSRGARAFLAINNASVAKTVTVHTGLRAGRYCDVIHSKGSNRACSGPTIRVDRRGWAAITVPAKDSVAITR